jgi:hypothetical protein
LRWARESVVLAVTIVAARSEKVLYVHAERLGELVDVGQGHVVLTAFDPARIGAMDACQVGQCLLA